MLPFLTAHAQLARFYTTENSLPNSRVNQIYQDSRGFIWISTENGLARFDGRDFLTFRFRRDKADALASDLVLSVFEDSRGTLWTGTSMGLQVFDPDSRSFRRIDLQDPSYPGSTQHISSIIEVKTGSVGSELWVATSQHGIYIIDPQTHSLKGSRRALLNRNLPSPFVYSLFQDSRGWVWLAGETGGLSVVDSQTMQSQGITLDPQTFIRDFEEDPASGNILIATMSGLYIYRAATHTLTRSNDPEGKDCEAYSLLFSKTVQKVGEKAFLVGTEANGLCLYDMDTDQLRQAYIPSVSQDISRWKVHSLLEDNQGNIWVGAFQTGVLVIPHSMYGFEFTRVNYGSVSSIARNPGDGSLWIGTDGGGLVRIAQDGTRTVFNASNSGLTNDSVLSLCFDKHGTLWIATYLDGIFLHPATGGFKPFADAQVLGTPNVSCLAYDPMQDLVYAGTYGAGMSTISVPAEKVVRQISEDINKWVSSLYIDRSGIVWMGTYNGPMCYNHSLGKLFSYNVGDAAIKARVYCFCEAADGKIWIGTGEGLTACDRNKGTVTVYSESDGLSSDVVDALLESADGTLWISTSDGLNRLDPETGVFSTYHAYDGLQGNEFCVGAAFKDSDGRLFFGGTGGVTSFYPQVVNQKTHPVPPLYFSRLTVLNEEVEYEADRSDNILDKPITEASTLTLPYKSNTFALEFSVLEYTNPLRIRYACRMDHYDKDWQYLPTPTHAASYTHLPAGHYTLHVKAYFDGTPAAYSATSIAIRILPPWYLTPWAIVSYILASLAFLALFLYYLKRRREHQAEKEMSEIKELKLKMFTNISHEIRTPLTLLMSPLKQMREAEQDPHQKDLYNLMYRNSLRILRLVNQIMDMRKVDEGQMRLHFLETDIVYFIRDIMQSFDNMAVTRQINLRLNPAAEVMNLWIDQGNFDKIVFNLLSNAFKHTPDGGHIEIGLSAPETNDGALAPEVASLMKITITNSGSHIDTPDLDKVFERFFQSDVLDAKMGSGVGLSLTKMLVELHHGVITAANTEDGVCFTVVMPIGCAHLTAEEMSATTHHKDLYTKRTSPEDLVRSTEDIAFAPTTEASDKIVKSKRNVVIVDDDPEIRDYLLAELRSLYNVKTFPGAQEAWADISATQPDAVVTDLVMSGMDGVELCRKIRNNPVTNHIPVIVLTSSADESSHLESIDSGADRFLSKPLSIELLRSSIAQVIHSRDTLRGKYSGNTRYDYEEVKVSSVGTNLKERVMDVVKRNLDNPEFGVDDLSREVGMSRVHLNRKLKEALGISPSSLIKSTRMKQAAYLLVHDKVNISEVAYRVGFSTPSYFSNSFRSYFGLSPKEFVVKYSDVTDRETLDKLFEV
jgi:signal transduction histidine kinase/ligand-binding sensor domain-containing protein/DNA-binding response OmpR family regulator